MTDKCRRRLLVTAYRRHTCAEDAGFFAADAFPVRTEIVHVVEIHGGDHRAVPVECVNRIEPPAEPDFQHGNVHILTDEDIHRSQRAEFKIRQRIRRACIFDTLECRHEAGIVDFAPRNPYALVVAQQMGRGVQADTIAGTGQNGLKHRAHRAFAVGTAYGNDRKIWPEAEPVAHRGHPFQPHVDGPGMDAFEIGQPVCERLRRNDAINGQRIQTSLNHGGTESAEENQNRNIVT